MAITLPDDLAVEAARAGLLEPERFARMLRAKLDAITAIDPHAFERLRALVQQMVDESGNAAGFDAAVWLRVWVHRPQPALGGARPLDYMDTAERQEVVMRLLGSIQSGSYQ